jgi:hypothetical protein
MSSLQMWLLQQQLLLVVVFAFVVVVVELEGRTLCSHLGSRRGGRRDILQERGRGEGKADASKPLINET